MNVVNKGMCRSLEVLFMAQGQGSVPTDEVDWTHWMVTDILFAVNAVIQC